MENYGFFEAQETSPGVWDREYTAAQFSVYFSKFVGNGVFGNPTNQLKVTAGSGLKVIVAAGWAFINGEWYENTAAKEIPLTPNQTGFARNDMIVVRATVATRKIEAIEVVNSTTPVRDAATHDLVLASYSMPPSATSITNAQIVDRRLDESVCGLVTSLLEVQTTEDLFAQYQAQFDEWFSEIEGQLGTDAATALQTQINNLYLISNSVPTSLLPNQVCFVRE